MARQSIKLPAFVLDQYRAAFDAIEANFVKLYANDLTGRKPVIAPTWVSDSLGASFRSIDANFTDLFAGIKTSNRLVVLPEWIGDDIRGTFAAITANFAELYAVNPFALGNIMFSGDSTIVGYFGMTGGPRKKFFQWLRAAGYTFASVGPYNTDSTGMLDVNHGGLSGDRMQYARDNIGAQVAAAQPNIVVLRYGMNDLGNGRTTAQYLADMAATVAAVKANAPGCKVFVADLVVPTSGAYAAFAAEYTTARAALPAAVATAGATFIPFASQPTLGDGVHEVDGPYGYDLIAGYFYTGVTGQTRPTSLVLKLSGATGVFTEKTGASATTVTTNGGPVGTWRDVANSINFTAATDGVRPLLTGVDIDATGVNSYLENTAVPVFYLTSEFTAFIEAAPNLGGNSLVISGPVFQIQKFINDWYIYINGISATFTDATSTTELLSVVFDGTQTGNANRLKVYRNKVLQTLNFNGTIPNVTAASLGIGIGDSYGGGASTPYRGKLRTFRVYDAALSDAARGVIETALGY